MVMQPGKQTFPFVPSLTQYSVYDPVEHSADEVQTAAQKPGPASGPVAQLPEAHSVFSVHGAPVGCVPPPSGDVLASVDPPSVVVAPQNPPLWAISRSSAQDDGSF